MQDITLYTHPFSRGTYVVWMLKECGAEYTVVPIPVSYTHLTLPTILRV